MTLGLWTSGIYSKLLHESVEESGLDPVLVSPSTEPYPRMNPPIIESTL